MSSAKLTKEKLEELYIQQRLPHTKIAKIYHLSPSTVYYWLKKWGIPITRGALQRRVSDETIMELWRQGLTDKEMAAKLNMSYYTISNRRCRLGLKPNRKYKWSEEQIQKAIELYQQGFSLNAASKLTGIGYASLCIIFRKRGVSLGRRYGDLLAFCEGRIKRVHLAPIKIPKEEWKLAYLAGLIDGEGSVYYTYFKGKRLIPNVKVANTDIKMIKWILDNFGGRISSKKGSRPKHWKTCYNWVTASIEGCYKILKAVLPYLITKKENALKVLEKCEERIREYEKLTSRRSLVFTSTL